MPEPVFRNTCYFCNAKWGNCTCRFDEHPDAGFLWCGTVITDPCVSDCGRFFVDPIECYGEAYTAWRDRRAEILSELLGRVRRRRTLVITIIPDAHFEWEATGNITRRT